MENYHKETSEEIKHFSKEVPAIEMKQMSI